MIETNLKYLPHDDSLMMLADLEKKMLVGYDYLKTVAVAAVFVVFLDRQRPNHESKVYNNQPRKIRRRRSKK